MKTISRIVAESTEFVFEEIGYGPSAKILRFAPVTRIDGIVWVHPTYARESTLAQMKGRASLLWQITSLWNPGPWRLVYQNASAGVLSKLAR
ncbi:MAG: hypothetical protein ACFUZC_03500 [Chthoniobacteraceae bacterium]